jgi:formimidoylglutamate deiminase
MGGLAETRAQLQDCFWSWREVMYKFAHNINPEQMAAIARQLYIEMLKSGYTSVAEFHYIHNQPEGKPYRQFGEMSDSVINAALECGIYQLHLPVLYMTSDFGNKPPKDGQKRFTMPLEAYLTILDSLLDRYSDNSSIGIGVAPHSLRAVPPEMLSRLLETLPDLGLEKCPVHIHIAEQQQEVENCLAWSKKRPVEWLMDNVNIDSRWCLIHATHLDDSEVTQLSKSCAVAGLCPTTEANLGDGIFPTPFYCWHGGRIGIGTDSHITINPWEEMKMLEYAQRLQRRQRNLLALPPHISTGRTIFERAAAGGAQALGLESGSIKAGNRADLIALDISYTRFAEKAEDELLDTAIFATSTPPVKNVWVGGRQVIKNGQHELQEKAEKELRKTIAELSSKG